MSPSRRPGNAPCEFCVGKWRREPGGPAADHRAGCAALPRTVPRTEPRHAKLSGCARCQAAHRADGAAARWGHRALPQRRTAAGTRGVHRQAARAVRTQRDRTTGHERRAHALWRGNAAPSPVAARHPRYRLPGLPAGGSPPAPPAAGPPGLEGVHIDVEDFQ